MFLLAAACVPTYAAPDIAQSDLSSRYPRALLVARNGVVRSAAVALVVFVAWLIADVVLRGRDRHHHGAAVLSAGAVAGLLGAAAVVVGGAGRYPEGAAYKLAMNGAFWLGPAALAGGVAWMVHGFRRGPADRGEAVWGLYLVLLGVFLTPAIFVTSVGLWICTGDC